MFKTLKDSELSSEESKNDDALSSNSENLSKQEEGAEITRLTPNVTDSKEDSYPDMPDSEEKTIEKEASIFNRFLKEGFDGITTNPNYKLLALLIILLINLSLFLLVGNLGKSFLQNSGLLS